LFFLPKNHPEFPKSLIRNTRLSAAAEAAAAPNFYIEEKEKEKIKEKKRNRSGRKKQT
jgi:hypothetical protein